MPENGKPPRHVADISCRLVVAADRYQDIGLVMDRVEHYMAEALKDCDVEAAFDFTHFNTNSCKASRLEERLSRMRYDGERGMARPVDPGPTLAQSFPSQGEDSF